MRTVSSVSELRAALGPARRHGSTVGLVPTMGALHAGHASLIAQARDESDVVVVSVFVNPTQFNEAADLDAYPRDLAGDIQAAEAAGADLVFAPGAADVYPPGHATTVTVGGDLTGTLEGAERGRGHFEGVTTVVAKLLNMVQPDAAYFGQKDAQQALVIRRMARDLNLPVRIVTCPTVRDADGLALSSRNARLSDGERKRALAISAGLRAAADALAAGEQDAAALRALVESERPHLIVPEIEAIATDELARIEAEARRSEERHHPPPQLLRRHALQHHVDADVAHRDPEARAGHGKHRRGQMGDQREHEDRRRADLQGAGVG